ncbi:MAG: hypothetical protein JRJ12_17800, partial [Deltaproteobacteria bacterium]|nr:hypothetical protein [Deltaproteobacteria bacterium]
NAKDAMPEGGKLTIETKNIILNEEFCRIHPKATPWEYVLLRVSDTGHGMNKETLAHIFEPFYSTKKPGKGTGLGLAMVYGIVASHQGFISCSSSSGAGTTFRIYLPVFEGAAAELEKQASEKPPQGEGETILVVDDEDYIRDLGEQMLSRAGYQDRCSAELATK